MSESAGAGAAVPRRTTHAWTLWLVAASCALHPLEEYFTGWQGWALETLRIVMPTARFVFFNTVLFVAALFAARTGWRRPALSLVIPAATLVNAVFFHILPTIVHHPPSPAVYPPT